jgi:hypothetical protein
LPQIPGTVTLILALTASVLLRHSALAAWTIWLAIAAIPGVTRAGACTTGRGYSKASARSHGPTTGSARTPAPAAASATISPTS